MADSQSTRIFTLVQREMREYRASLFWTPIVIAAVLIFLMMVSVLLSDRITMLGDTLLQVMMQEESLSGMSISINIDEETDAGSPRVITLDGPEEPAAGPPDGAAPAAPAPPSPPDWRIEREAGPVDEEEWNFSREWTFTPKPGFAQDGEKDDPVESLNPVLNILHGLLLLVLLGVSVHYLLGALFSDRKDRSILFWKSMPVSEWEEVLAKFAVALVVAPAVYIAVSVVMQFAYILLAMLMAHRMEMDPMEAIVDKIEFGGLFLNQLGGWLITALWVAPLYAWLLLASAGARRSPFMLAIAPVLGLVLLEQIFIGSGFVAGAVYNHLPHFIVGGNSMGFYIHGPDWSGQDLVSLLLGLLFAAGALWGCVYLRRYRFEI